jgi:transcriptional regulator with XRE-family HTH domain
MGVRKEHKLDQEEFLDDIGVSNGEVMILMKISVRSLSIRE